MGEFMDRLAGQGFAAEQVAPGVFVAGKLSDKESEDRIKQRCIAMANEADNERRRNEDVKAALRFMKNEPTDAELAESLKARMREALEPVRKLLDEGTAHGMTVQFNINVSPPSPKWQITGISVVKHL